MPEKRRRKLVWALATYGRYSPWANFLILLAVSSARTWWPTMPPIVLWILSVMAGVWAIVATWATNNRDRLNAERQLQEVLQNLATTVASKTPEGAQIRVNVMTPNEKQGFLQVRWHVNMDSELERNLGWAKGQGCAGRAFETQQIQSEDLSQYQKSDFEELRGRDGQTPWGMSRDHWQLTRHLGSVVSIHIPSPRRPFKPVGVLNIDSVHPLPVTGLDGAEVLDMVSETHLPIVSSLMGDAGV